MTYWSGYYPGGLYVPDPWQNTWIPKHFPEHHYPLEHTRHAISRIAHDFSHAGSLGDVMTCPRSDIRESMTTFYIDVELPGVANEKQMSLKWLGSQTLLLRATVPRATTPEDDVPVKQTEEDKSRAAKDGDIHQDKSDREEGAKPEGDAHSVYLTLGERRVGTYGRAFNFPVDVDHDVTTAKLDAGLLRLTVSKLPEASKIDKKVSVQTGESHETPSNGVGAAE